MEGKSTVPRRKSNNSSRNAPAKRSRRKRPAPKLTIVTTETWTITWAREATEQSVQREPLIVVHESVEIVPELEIDFHTATGPGATAKEHAE